MYNMTNISSDKMIFSIDELKALGFSYYKIKNMIELGVIAKLNKRYYENLGYQGDNEDFYYAYAYIPKGVICLMSAASYYGLTSFIPKEIDVAIPRKSKVSTLPNWPKINIFYYTDERFNTGIINISDGPNKFRIYDIEKTVVDIVYYREKIGIEETKEVLITYLGRSDRNLNKLVKYANKIKCSDILNKYLEVLL